MQSKASALLPFLDLTRLNENDTAASIATLCQQAIHPVDTVAAVCVYPVFVREAVTLLAATSIKVAAVANFPFPVLTVTEATALIQQIIQDGADEIDVVFPYDIFLAGHTQAAGDFIRQCKKTCGKKHVLKVILEISQLKTVENIAAASRCAILNGADFLKTSTGKVMSGATLDASRVMLEVIKQAGGVVGFKASGGIRSLQEAMQYKALAEEIMGVDWPTPATFRIGASQLLV